MRSPRRRASGPSPVIILSLLAGMAWAGAAAAQLPMDRQLAISALKHTDYGLRFLRERQAEDGSWAGSVYATARALQAFLGSYRGYEEADGAFITRPVAYLLAAVNADGSIGGEDGHAVRDTAAALLALEATRNPRHAGVIGDAAAFLARPQAVEGQCAGRPPGTDAPAGDDAGHGPALALQGLTLEALRAAGLDSSSPVLEKGLAYLDRLQGPPAGGRGGFAAPPAPSAERHPATVRLAHAGLAALHAAGVAGDDPRVTAALGRIGDHYAMGEPMDADPVLGPLFYQERAAAGMAGFAPATVETPAGARNWRNDLVAGLLARHNADGSWGDPHGPRDLATAHAVMALNRVARSLR